MSTQDACRVLGGMRARVPARAAITFQPGASRHWLALAASGVRSHKENLHAQIPWCYAGLPVVGEIRAPGYLEGGDFFPAGRDLAIVGIGLRSNFEAARQLMDGDLLGTTRLAVVRDEFEQHQVWDWRFIGSLGLRSRVQGGGLTVVQASVSSTRWRGPEGLLGSA